MRLLQQSGLGLWRALLARLHTPSAGHGIQRVSLPEDLVRVALNGSILTGHGDPLLGQA